MLPTRATILTESTPTQTFGGRVQFMKRRLRRFRRPVAELDVLLAGAVAEARFHAAHAEAGGAVDRQAALDVALRHARNPAQAARWVEARLAVIARRFAEPRVWSAIEDTARTLMMHKTMTGGALFALCRRLADQLHRPGIAMRGWPGYVTLSRQAFPDGTAPDAPPATAMWRIIVRIAAVAALLHLLVRLAAS
jgi:hypothetical protein